MWLEVYCELLVTISARTTVTYRLDSDWDPRWITHTLWSGGLSFSLVQFFAIWASLEGWLWVLTTWELAPPEWVIQEIDQGESPRALCSLVSEGTHLHILFIRSKSLSTQGAGSWDLPMEGRGHFKEFVDIFETTTQKICLNLLLLIWSIHCFGQVHIA